MIEYFAPLDDIRFVLNEIVGLDEIADLPGYQELSPDLVDAVMEEAGKFGREVLAPLNQIGDQEGARLENGVVRMPQGFHQAYTQFAEAGWIGISIDPQWGGQGLPRLLSAAVQEIWCAANLAFSLSPMMNQAAADLLGRHGSDAQREKFLPKIVSGEWAATMNLTEPQAGSDLGRLRCKAEKDGDHYKITGQKIFITYGDHEMTANIIHLVLARVAGAPAGAAGISLFLVPKYLLNEDGSPGRRNDLRCVSLEHKLGIHASPTAVMSYGDEGGAIGYLVGEENRGLNCMFAMMNFSRLGVAIQGPAIAERSYQLARAYAEERLQGAAIDSQSKEAVAIIHHPDVRRMLMAMAAQAEASRALMLYIAACQDKAARHPEASARAANETRQALLLPIAKGWGTEGGIEAANLGVQVHGGVGFIEETGAAQFLRDGRISAIYEGTTGIQANDLLFRKVVRDQGAAMGALLGDMRQAQAELAASPDETLTAIAARLGQAITHLQEATDWLLGTNAQDPSRAAVGAVHYLRLAGIALGGWFMARAARVAYGKLDAGEGDAAFLARKILIARFFADQVMPDCSMLLAKIMDGAGAVMDGEGGVF